jgi:hypothetical protein
VAEAAAAGKTNTAKKTNAPMLLADARKALALVIKGARVGVDLQEGVDVDASEALSEEEINRQNAFAANEAFDMSEAEEDEAAASLATYKQGVRHHEKDEKDGSGRERD